MNRKQSLALKNGTLVETGTFDTLIAKRGYFYSLFTISDSSSDIPKVSYDIVS